MIILLEVEVEHLAGKFASKADIAEALAQLIDIGEVEVDEATYDVVSVTDVSK